jgi:cellulose synthase/poly-beta-1,6-N-acetylglucosamine synthase-like glycosyltransferase
MTDDTTNQTNQAAQAAGTPHQPLVSVVVIGRNEGERLRRCLQSVFAMARPNFDIEVIYADSNSTDDSLALAAALGATNLTLKPERPSAAIGRNAGWRVAKGDYVLFLDGDTILHTEFVASALPEFAKADVGIVCGNRRELFPKRSFFNRVLDIEWIYPEGPTTHCGGDALFRRELLVNNNGFDPTLIAGEEPELCRRIRAQGYIVLHVDRPMTGHDIDMTKWSQYWRRCTRTGHAFAEVSDRFRDTDQPFWSHASAHNRNRFLVLTLGLLTGVAASIALRSLLPIAFYLLAFALLSIRTAWKVSWKTNDRVGLLMYGVHSHIQQIPTYIGQLQYRLSRRRGERLALFEYK